jgi:hypothetical protein
MAFRAASTYRIDPPLGNLRLRAVHGNGRNLTLPPNNPERYWSADLRIGTTAASTRRKRRVGDRRSGGSVKLRPPAIRLPLTFSIEPSTLKQVMPLRVLIVPDKFKGTLPAAAAARAIATGWRGARPRDLLGFLPMTDGGDGFGEVLGGLIRARVHYTRTVDAAHRPCSAPWWWEPESRSAIIESAGVIGLAMLPPGRFHPFARDTFGLGAVLRAAAARGAKQCLVGIGGSATNDGGFGVARALGWEFVDETGGRIEQWTELNRLCRIRAPLKRRWFSRLLVAVDVDNPLLGRRGATRVYGPQKGLRPGDIARAERCLRRLAQVVTRDLGRDLAGARRALARRAGWVSGCKPFAARDWNRASACLRATRRSNVGCVPPIWSLWPRVRLMPPHSWARGWDRWRPAVASWAFLVLRWREWSRPGLRVSGFSRRHMP